MTDVRPLCPECGCPARYVLAPAMIRFELNLDGTERRVLSARGVKRGPSDTYECGGGHTWQTTPPPFDADDDRDV